MNIIPVLIGIAGAAAYLFFGPLVLTGGKGDGSNAYQNLFFIRIFDGHLAAAELAQELFEYRYRWCRPWMWFIDKGKREMELTSHEIETQAAYLIYDADADEYRKGEANSMGVYNWLKDLSPAQLEAEMVARTPKAVAWVTKNRKRLERHK